MADLTALHREDPLVCPDPLALLDHLADRLDHLVLPALRVPAALLDLVALMALAEVFLVSV
jgi:hypothetical protein